MRRLKILSTASYAGLIIYLVFFARKRYFEERVINYTPFRSTYNYYISVEMDSQREVYYFFTNILGNIILFLPIPAIVSLFLAHKLKYNILLIAFCLSLFIEITQYLFKAGVADIDDVLLNMVGAVLGLLFSKRTANHQQVG